MSGRRRRVIGVMGGAAGEAGAMRMAGELGRLIAGAGYALLTGGRGAGVMLAASRGASEAGGLVIGVLPGHRPQDANEYVDLAIATGIGDARNLVNVLSSDVVVACPGGAGTLSEVALAMKNGKPVVLLNFDPGPRAAEAEAAGLLARASSPAEAMERVEEFLG